MVKNEWDMKKSILTVTEFHMMFRSSSSRAPTSQKNPRISLLLDNISKCTEGPNMVSNNCFSLKNEIIGLYLFIFW